MEPVNGASEAATRQPIRQPGPNALRVALSVTAVALGVWSALQWSLIGTSIDARIKAVASGDHGPALDHLIFSGRPTSTIDHDLAVRMGGPEGVAGRELRTEMFSTTATLGTREIALRLSTTAYRTIGVLLALTLTGAWRSRRANRRRLGELDG